MTKLVTIPEALAQKIRARKPFSEKEGGSILGYRTRGGSYIIASAAWIGDGGKTRDLILVLPAFGADNSTGLAAIQLYVAVAPELVAEVERVLR